MSRHSLALARLQYAASATGNGTTLDVAGLATVAFQVLGTFTATVTFEATIDGATWVALQAFPSTGSTAVTTATAPGIWIAPCAGFSLVRARVTWTSGTSVTVLAAASAESTVSIAGGSSVDTELPAAAALTADAVASPTAPAVAAFGHGYNGTTWDRIRTATADALASTGLLAAANMVYNGTTWDRIRAGSPTGDPGATGVLAAQMHISNGASTTRLLAVNGVTDASAGSFTASVGSYIYNGASWDRIRANIEATALASTPRTATTNSSDITNHNARGVLLALDVTATPNNAETLTLAVQAKDAISGKYVTMTTFAALTASTLGATPTAETYLYTVYPAAVETAATAKHEVQALPLPRTWRVAMTHSAGGSWTYSVAAAQIT